MTVRLVGVFAHPDDDASLIGGTLLLLGDAVELTLVIATSGGAGPITDPSMATRDSLAQVREKEQRAYLRGAGRPDAPVHFLRHPDYYVDRSTERSSEVGSNSAGRACCSTPRASPTNGSPCAWIRDRFGTTSSRGSFCTGRS